MSRLSDNASLLRIATFPLLATALALLFTLPVWQWLWREWQGNQYYSHGMLIPVVSLYLAIQRLRLDRSLDGSWRGRYFVGVVLLGVSQLLFLWFFYSKAFFLASFAIIGVVASLIWIFSGAATLRKVLFPVAYLALMVPLPFLDRATLPLALFTGVCSGQLVQFLGMNVQVVGNAVQLPNANLLIGAQCSGINSLITLTSLTTLAAYLLQGPWIGRVLLILSSIPLAIAGNILRVASLLFVAQGYGAEAAFTFYHDYSGILFFLMAMALLYPLAQLLRCAKLRLDVI